MNNPTIKYGVNAGLILMAYTFVLYFVDQTLLGEMKALIPGIIILIIAGVKAVKVHKIAGNGIIDFKSAFVQSFLCMAIAGLLSTVASIVLFDFMDSGLKDVVAEHIVENTVSMMENFNAPADAIEEALSDMEDLPESFGFLGQLKSYFSGLIFYAIVALIIGAIMKSKSDVLRDDAVLS